MSRDSTTPAESRLDTEVRTASGRTERNFAIVLTAAFLLVTVPVMLHHEMWRDEVQAWLLARDSASLPDLFRALHYEGHPALWYLFLRPIAQAVRDPRWIQPIALLLSCCTVYVFGRFAPFSRLIRVLFAFGYFVVYGWTIVARSYGLGLTLAVVLCVLIARPRPRYRSAAIVLALLANTSVYGAMIVVACVIALVADAFVAPSGVARRDRLRRVATPAVVGMAAVLFAAMQVRPAPDNNFVGPALAGVTRTHAFGLFQQPLLAFTPIWRGYVPIPRMEETSDIWWANFLVDRSHKGALLAGTLAIVGVVVLATLVRRSMLALSFYLSATLILFLFTAFVYGGSLYHHGYFLLAAIMALWFAAAQAANEPLEQHRPAATATVRWIDGRMQLAIITLLGLNVVGGAFRLVADYLIPFSESQPVADYIRSRGLARAPIAVSPGFNGVAVSAYLGRPIFSLDRNMLTTFAPLQFPGGGVPDTVALARINVCCVRPDTAAILLLDHRLDAASDSLVVQPMAAFDHALVPERFFIYQVRRR